MTLLQSIEKLIENISVTDRQEKNIALSFENLRRNLLKMESKLKVQEVFLNGSYERDTIIRPLDDIDLFAILSFEDYNDNGLDPNPQVILNKFKSYLNSLGDYKDKVKQDRPCVTVVLSDKNFDVLPTLLKNGAYWIPNHDLSGWTLTNPKVQTDNLNMVNKKCGYKVKPVVKAVKYWKREVEQKIPSFHVEEIAINIFNLRSFSNFEEGIRMWFQYAESFLDNGRFNSYTSYSEVKEKIKQVKKKLKEARELYDEGKEGDAKRIWREVFGKEFPVITEEEAKKISKSLSEGSLKYNAKLGLSTNTGAVIRASKGFYGDLF